MSEPRTGTGPGQSADDRPQQARPVRRRFGYHDIEFGRCRDLLAVHTVGRLAWTAADGPQLFPVSYTWIDGLIVFRASPYSILSELVQRTAVVFEVDDINETDRAGWSVIVRGRTAGIASPDWLSWPSAVVPVPSASGHRHLAIGITPTEITGRHFARVADVDDETSGRG